MRDGPIKCPLAAQPGITHREGMSRIILTMAALAVVVQPAVAVPLQPTGKWTMDYTPTSCEAKRRFGNIAIAIIPGPLGESTRVMVELPGKAGRARQHPAVIDPGDGRDRKSVV